MAAFENCEIFFTYYFSYVWYKAALRRGNENRFEQTENRINSLEDLNNRGLARPKTVLENKANGLYENHLDGDIKLLREEISSKKYIIKT